LEYLEERALLDASSGLIGGAFNNLALNSNFNQASNGFISPIPGANNFGSSGIANGANPQHALAFTGLANSDVGAQSASSTFLAQDQLYSQFRLFAVNSQGPDFQLEQQQLINFLVPSFGFGSGTWPNRPWMPAAYNVGLANHQFGYPSQSDNGFLSAPQWTYPMPGTIPIGQHQAEQQLGDDDGILLEKPEQKMPQKSMLQQKQNQQEETQQKWIDDDTDDMDETGGVWMETSASEKASLADQVLQEDAYLPASVWLTIFAPAPMTALVAGLPGAAFPAVAAEAEGADAGFAFAE